MLAALSEDGGSQGVGGALTAFNSLPDVIFGELGRKATEVSIEECQLEVKGGLLRANRLHRSTQEYTDCDSTAEKSIQRLSQTPGPGALTFKCVFSCNNMVLWVSESCSCCWSSRLDFVASVMSSSASRNWAIRLLFSVRSFDSMPSA